MPNTKKFQDQPKRQNPEPNKQPVKQPDTDTNPKQPEKPNDE